MSTTTTTTTTDPAPDTSTLRQRRMEKGLLFTYWILSPDHKGLLPVTKYSALRAEENGAEAILGYRMLYFEVDGIEYPRQQTGAMIGIRPTNLLAASNGETTTHDS